jgi:hypothetical protein
MANFLNPHTEHDHTFNKLAHNYKGVKPGEEFHLPLNFIGDNNKGWEITGHYDIKKSNKVAKDCNEDKTCISENCCKYEFHIEMALHHPHEKGH